MDFVKMHGAGNDFIVIEGPFLPDAVDVAAWCDRRRGVGADGVLVVLPLSTNRVSMRYWNADGGEAEMCGNGLRCVARYAFDIDWVSGEEFTVESAVGDHLVTVGGDYVVASMGEPTPSRSGSFTIAEREVHPFSIGNPHAVLFVDDVEGTDVAALGQLIENDPIFPNGTNVEFVEVLVEDGIKMRVWERGVGETMASGTGATAAAYISHTVRDVPAPIDVHLPGGTLTVWFDDGGAWMRGPAEYSFAGSI